MLARTEPIVAVPDTRPPSWSAESGAGNAVAPEAWGLVVLALLLRLPGLFSFDLWQDEIYSIYEAKYLFGSPIGPGGIGLRPLYFFLLHPLADAWPHATALLRLPSLAFGIAGVLATWLLARRYAGRSAAFVATLALALLPLHIGGSQMIRWISLVFLIGAMLTHAVIRALDTDEARDHYATLGLALAGSLTHVTFLLPLTGLALGAHLVREDGRIGMRWPTRRAFLLCWLPFLAVLGTYYAVLAALLPAERLLGDATGGSPGRFLPAVFYHLTPALMAAAGIGGLWLFRTDAVPQRRLALMALLGVGLPVALMQVGGSYGLVPVSALYLAGALPAFLVAAGAAICAINAVRLGRGPALAFGLVLAASLLPGTASHLFDGSRFEFRKPLLVVQRREPGATVLLYPVIHARWEVPELDAVEFRPGLGTPFLDSLSAAHPQFWAILPLRRAGLMADGDGAKYRWFTRHCELQAAYRRPRFDYERFDTELYRCTSSDAP